MPRHLTHFLLGLSLPNAVERLAFLCVPTDMNSYFDIFTVTLLLAYHFLNLPLSQSTISSHNSLVAFVPE